MRYELVYLHLTMCTNAGDSYMVVSGIPQENGTRHLMHLSDVALELMTVRGSSRSR